MATAIPPKENTPTLNELRRNARRLKQLKDREKALKAERLQLFRQAKAEKAALRAIADAASMSSAGVLRVIERSEGPPVGVLMDELVIDE